MRILELVEQMAAESCACGGVQFMTSEGIVPAPAETLSPLHDPHWRPAPRPDGSLVQDPEFSVPTLAGAFTWRLFHDSARSDQESEWGYGRRASAPLRLVSDGTNVVVMHEDGTDREYVHQGSGAYSVVGASNGDTLVRNTLTDDSWDETHGATGFRYHFPAGEYVSLSYRATPRDLRLTYVYVNGVLRRAVEPTGARFTFEYGDPLATRVEDIRLPDQRRWTFDYDFSLTVLESVTGPSGCLTQYGYLSNLLTSVTDPEGYETTYTYDSPNPWGRVTSRSVAGNLEEYEYSTAGAVQQTRAKNATGCICTHLTEDGYPTGKIDALGSRQTFVYVEGLPLEFTDGLGRATSYAFDASGFRTAQRDALGSRWRGVIT